MSVIKLVQGDNRPYIRLTLTSPDGDTINVSTATVVVKFRRAQTTNVLATLPCAKPNGGSDGVVVFNFPGATLDVPPGAYEGEIEINFDGGEVQTVFDVLQFNVRAEF
jgi:hypothetical protein